MGFLMSVLGLIPGVLNFATQWQKNRYDAQVQLTTVKVGGNVELAKSLVSAQNEAEHARVTGLSIIAGSTVLLRLVVLFAAPLVIFMFKVIVWDKVFGWGSTDPICGGLEHCMVGDWANTIIWAIFGSTTALGGISAITTTLRNNKV